MCKYERRCHLYKGWDGKKKESVDVDYVIPSRYMGLNSATYGQKYYVIKIAYIATKSKF